MALDAAVKIGVDVLESDVHLTKDDIPILFHDEDLRRTTGVEGTVRQKTLDELLQIDLGHTFTVDDGVTYPFRGKGLGVVTLEEAFERFPDMVFNLDMKDTFLTAPMELARIITKMKRTDSVVVGSFHGDQLERFRELIPEVATSAHPGEVKRFVLNTKIGLPRIKKEDVPYKAFQVPTKSGPLTVVTDKFVRKAHNYDIAVHVWTINEKDEMERLLDLGVDGIFTDFPSRLREVLVDRGLL